MRQVFQPTHFANGNSRTRKVRDDDHRSVLISPSPQLPGVYLPLILYEDSYQQRGHDFISGSVFDRERTVRRICQINFPSVYGLYGGVTRLFPRFPAPSRLRSKLKRTEGRREKGNASLLP